MDKKIQQLEHAVYCLTEEIKTKDSRLSGVENLGKLLHEKEEECEELKERIKSLEVSSRRLEGRIIQLNQLHGSGPQFGFKEGFIRPGVSLKVLEALSRDNAKFRSALEHITQLGPRGPDVAVKVTELHSLTLQLRDDLRAKERQIKELEDCLAAINSSDKDELKSQITRLSADYAKMQRTINAKQSFCESVIKENEGLNEVLIKVEGSRYFSPKVGDSSKSETQDTVDAPHTVQSLKSELEQLQLQSSTVESEDVSELEEKIKSLEEELQFVIQALQERDQEREDTRSQLQEEKKQKEQLQERVRKGEERIDENEQHIQTMLDEFEQERRRIAVDKEHLKIALKNKCEELEEKKMEETLMQEQFKAFENDFLREQTEANELRETNAEQRRKIEHLQQESTRFSSQLQRMNLEAESNKKAIDHFSQQNKSLREQIKGLEDELRSYKSMISKQPFPRPCGDPLPMQDYRRTQTVGTRGGPDLQTDCGGKEIPEMYRTNKNDGQLSRQSSRHSPTSPSTDDLMQCPYCHEFTRDFDNHFLLYHGNSSSSQDYSRQSRVQCSVCQAWAPHYMWSFAVIGLFNKSTRAI